MPESAVSDSQQLLVISLDGFPWSLLRNAGQDWFPGLMKRLPIRGLQSMNSVFPTVSSVAWSSYISGRNPGGHGIFGFVDRAFDPFRLILPNASNRRGPVLWKVLEKAGVRSVIMNIPVTYPPEPINGVLVSGFLGVNLSQSVTPPDYYEVLREHDYSIDADTSIISDDPIGFLEQLSRHVTARCQAFSRFLELEKWHFAHLHLMETDRLFHFFWEHVENASSTYHGRIVKLFHQIDTQICQVLDHVSDKCELLMMSDHGFCGTQVEYNLNSFLVHAGWMKWRPSEQGLDRIATESKAYSLLPGRIYFNRSDREPNGHIAPTELIQLKQELRHQLIALKQPGSQQTVLKDVLDGTDLFTGECAHIAPDLIAVPNDGIELKGRLAPAPLSQPSRLQGMHTTDDAFFWSRHSLTINEKPSLYDIYPTILNFFGLIDETAEGNCVINW